MKKIIILTLICLIFSGTSFAAENVSAGSDAQALLNSLSSVTPSDAGAQPQQDVMDTPNADVPLNEDDNVFLRDSNNARPTTSDVARLHPRDAMDSNMFDNFNAPLGRFGMEFFANKRGIVDAPASDSYVLAIGDEVKLSVWGIEEFHERLRIDSDGSLALPRAGVVDAVGMTFGQLKKAIREAYSQILKDFQINVSMGTIGNITVYVAGAAQSPGAYAVSSSSSIIDVLAQAGGPSLSGSLRKIELRRKNKTIHTIDAYDLLLRGVLEQDVRVIDGDVIFIHTVGALVSVGGNVKRPAIYELSGKEAKLSDVLALAGGITSGAFTGRVQVTNVHNNEYRTVYEIELSEGQNVARVVRDGDTVKVFAVMGTYVSVRIAGAVATPGEYMITPGATTLEDVLKRAGGLLYTAEGTGELARVEITPNGPIHTRMDVNLKDAMQGRNSLFLQRDDYIFVRTIPDLEGGRVVSVTGRVRQPGSYTARRGEKLSSLIERAGGYAEGAFLRGAMFTRESVRRDQQKNINDMAVQLERDVLTTSTEAILTAPDEKDANFARIAATQKRQLIRNLRSLRATGRVAIVLPPEYKLLKGSTFDIEVQNGDTLHIPEKPGTVQVIGSVFTPSAFVFRSGQPFTEYVKLSGGFTSSANSKGTYIVAPDGTTKKAFSGRTPVKLEEGDFVVVPEKLAFTPTLRNTLSLVDILQKLVLGVASIHYVFK